MNCGHMTPPITPLGKWLISTAVQEAVPLPTLNSSLVTPSISQLMMEAMVVNCGHMTPPITPHGKWLISTAVQQAVPLDSTCTSSLAIRSTSVRMMEVAATNCGRIVLQASITKRTRGEPSPRGPSTQVYQAVSPLAPTTERSTGHRPKCGRKHPTWFGPTTAVGQAWPTSTSPWLTSCRRFPILQRI